MVAGAVTVRYFGVAATSGWLQVPLLCVTLASRPPLGGCRCRYCALLWRRGHLWVVAGAVTVRYFGVAATSGWLQVPLLCVTLASRPPLGGCRCRYCALLWRRGHLWVVAGAVTVRYFGVAAHLWVVAGAVTVRYFGVAATSGWLQVPLLCVTLASRPPLGGCRCRYCALLWRRGHLWVVAGAVTVRYFGVAATSGWLQVPLLCVTLASRPPLGGCRCRYCALLWRRGHLWVVAGAVTVRYFGVAATSGWLQVPLLCVTLASRPPLGGCRCRYCALLWRRGHLWVVAGAVNVRYFGVAATSGWLQVPLLCVTLASRPPLGGCRCRYCALLWRRGHLWVVAGAVTVRYFGVAATSGWLQVPLLCVTLASRPPLGGCRCRYCALLWRRGHLWVVAGAVTVRYFGVAATSGWLQVPLLCVTLASRPPLGGCRCRYCALLWRRGHLWVVAGAVTVRYFGVAATSGWLQVPLLCVTLASRPPLGGCRCRYCALLWRRGHLWVVAGAVTVRYFGVAATSGWLQVPLLCVTLASRPPLGGCRCRYCALLWRRGHLWVVAGGRGGKIGEKKDFGGENVLTLKSVNAAETFTFQLI